MKDGKEEKKNKKKNVIRFFSSFWCCVSACVCLHFFFHLPERDPHILKHFCFRFYFLALNTVRKQARRKLRESTHKKYIHKQHHKMKCIFSSIVAVHLLFCCWCLIFDTISLCLSVSSCFECCTVCAQYFDSVERRQYESYDNMWKWDEKLKCIFCWNFPFNWPTFSAVHSFHLQ